VSEARNAPKRSLLAQERSRDTRQAIIKAALALWSERGYATGIDDTTAEAICERAASRRRRSTSTSPARTTYC